MELKTMKTLALTSAVALGIAASGPVQAQVETITAQLITSSAITSNTVSNMDFGTWLVQFAGSDAPVITLTDDASVASTQTGTIANGSQVVQITAPATEGVITVQIPAPGALTMTASNFSDIVDAGLSLDSVTYRTASENGTVVSSGAVDTADTITVLAAATDETVRFGGNINISSTPADATHTASMDITFSY